MASRYPTGIDLAFNEAPGGGSVRPGEHDGVLQLARNGSSAAWTQRGRRRVILELLQKTSAAGDGTRERLLRHSNRHTRLAP